MSYLVHQFKVVISWPWWRYLYATLCYDVLLTRRSTVWWRCLHTHKMMTSQFNDRWHHSIDWIVYTVNIFLTFQQKMQSCRFKLMELCSWCYWNKMLIFIILIWNKGLCGLQINRCADSGVVQDYHMIAEIQ